MSLKSGAAPLVHSILIILTTKFVHNFLLHPNYFAELANCYAIRLVMIEKVLFQ